MLAREAPASLKFFAPPEMRGIWFLRHSWSGYVNIIVNGVTSTENLRAETQDLLYYVEISYAGTEREIEISLPASSNPASHRQIWITGFEFSKLPKLPQRSYVLTQWTRFVVSSEGLFVVLENDVDIPAAIMREGCWAPEHLIEFRQHINAGDVVVDVGANFGHHSVAFSRMVGEGGLVIAIEPQLLMIQLLSANSVINGCYNIATVHAAAGARRGRVRMFPVDYRTRGNFGSLGVAFTSKRSLKSNGPLIQQKTVDSISQRLVGDRKISFVKIDVQAYELYVLQGMSRIIQESRPKIFCEISPYWMRLKGYDYRDVYTLLRSAGYTMRHFSRKEIHFGPDGTPLVDKSSKIEWDILALP